MADYASMSAANPYRNQQSKEGILQTIWKSFGGRTYNDAWNENMAVQAAEYEAQLEQMRFQNEFNSPSAQVARMREAGLNPDLQGLGDVVGAANPPQDPSTPMQADSDCPVVENVVNMTFSAFNTALGIAQGLQGMHSVFLDNNLKKIAEKNGVLDLAKTMWPSFLPESPDPAAGDGLSLLPGHFDWKAAATKNAENFVGHLNKRHRKMFLDSVRNYWNSGPGQYESYDAWTKRVKSRREFYKERDTFYSDIDDVLNDMISPLANTLQQIQSQGLSTELAESQAAQNQAEYTKELYGENGLDPMAEAGATNAERGLSETNNAMVKELNDSIGEIIHNLKSTADSDHGLKGALANIALVLMSSVRLYLASGHGLSISSSSSQSVGKTTSSSKFHSFSF